MAKPLLVAPSPAVALLDPYVIERPVIDPDLVLDFNESLAPPASLAGAACAVHRYPEYDEIEQFIADRLAIEKRSVVLTCGADDALERAVRCVLAPGRRAILTTPSYGMIRRFAMLAGAEVDEVEWWTGDLPVDEMCGLADDDVDLVAIVSPSNPSGAVVSSAAFERLVARLPQALVVLDQAYVDFCDPVFDLSSVALRHPNVVVVRTLSKAWGCAGLRVGYAFGDPRVIDWMRRVGQPFPVASPSIGAAMAALAAGPDLHRIASVCEQREGLSGLLRDLGAEVLPSNGSFVLARFGDAEFVWRGLGALGISVRRFSGRSDLEGWLRITLPGDEESFARLVRGLKTVLSPEAVLFDMDGVLADVSGSYRRAIIETAATWGVELSGRDIALAKAEGDAANDWELTRKLLAARGVEADIDQVTNRFEAVYQGTEESPGLRRFESLRITRAVLENVASKYRLAVVTGRPRADAQRFLEEQAIGDLFSALVCMEDAAAKPDPKPVKIALSRVGGSTAWMFGDTPDDVRAARGAGVLAIGVTAPGDDVESASAALHKAGAVAVIEHPNTIREIMP